MLEVKEIRERFDYMVTSWHDIREAAKLDMKAVSGDPWSADEKAQRKKNNRPSLTFDELHQHINQTINQMRSNKLAVIIKPEGGGAENKHAQLRQARIRQIEYESKAQTAFLTAYENMIQMSYGYFGLATQYCDEDCFEQKLAVRRFPNANAILIDPDTKKADCSDMMDAFVLDLLPKKQFKRQWPDATIQDFSPTDLLTAPAWISDTNVQVAEYWKVETGYRNLLLVDQLGKIHEDELKVRGLQKQKDAVLMPDGTSFKLLDQRKTETRKVKQYITNGLEVLEENDWLGKWIPIFPVLGKELYVDSGGGAKRILLSRVRMAREPFMFYCYVRSAQAELIRMTPKFPYLGYEGQFDTTTDWEHINDIPTAYAEVKQTTDAGGNLLPLPVRQPYEPAIAALEMAAEAAKRAIQSAFGSFNASIGKEDTHARSGIAIKSLQQQSTEGTYHYVDTYINTLEHYGRCVNDLLDKIETGPRDVAIMNPDETSEMRRINEPFMGDDGKEQIHSYGEGNFSVVVTVGPSHQTAREEASDFLDTLISNIQVLPLAPEIKTKLLSLAIKLKELGPLGDEMARIIDPSQNQEQMPPQAIAKLQQASQIIQTLSQQLEMLTQERETKKLELDSKLEIIKLQEKTKVLVAEIGAKAQEAQLRLKMEQEMWAELHGAAHEVGMAAHGAALAATIPGPGIASNATPQQKQETQEGD